jgi:hypothetical protein
MASKKKKKPVEPAEIVVGEAGPEKVLPTVKAKKAAAGDLVKVFDPAMGINGLYEVAEITDEGVIISPTSGETHQRMRVSAESIQQIYRGAS